MPHAPETDTGTPPLLAVHNGVATLTLNRPAHRNRLHDDDLRTLLEHFRAIDADASVRVVVLAGQVLAERPVFCSGYHLGQIGTERAGDSFEPVADALEALRPLTIAALNGSVYGGATDLVLACDFAIGMHGIEMRMPAGALGLHYYPSGISRFVARLGVTWAKQVFLGAATFGSDQLLAMGFVQRLVAQADHAAAVQHQVEALCALAPLAVQGMKASLNEVARGEYDVVRLRARHQHTQASSDFAEGRRAFAERRAPVFTGR